MKSKRITYPKAGITKSAQFRENRKLRLGELLIAEKLLTPDQISDAIEAQQLYGSRFGTSLVELGFLDEDTIAETLSNKLNLPYIDALALMNIPKEVLALLPRDLVLKHQVIPCDGDSKKLYLAMADPLNLTIIDDLAFRLNCKVFPVVVPEIRLMFALHKYYEMPLSPRLKTLAQHLLDKKIHRTDDVASPWLDSPDLELQRKNQATDSLVPEKPQTEAVQPNPAAQPAPKTQAAPSAPSKPGKMSLSDVWTLLAEAKTREDIAQILLSYIGQEFNCGAILSIKGDTAFGWNAVLNAKPLFNFNQLTITLDQTSMIRRVVENKTYYLGTPGTDEQDIRLLRCFANRPPEAVMLVPILIKNRLIGTLYIQDENSRLNQKLDEVLKIVSKTTMSFEILILKGKILMT